MKKLLALLLAGILIFALVGCNKAEVHEKTDKAEVHEKTDKAEVHEKTDKAEVHEETDNSGYSEELDESEDVVKKVGMVYGDDEIAITLTKPDGAEFTLVGDDPLDSGDMVGLCADDYSWDAEIMGYKYYEGIGSNEPFVDYYFSGSVVSEDYDSYEQEEIDLGIDYEGKPVKLIRYTFKETGDEEEYKECFVGFEYKGTEDSGLFGLKIGAFEEELSDSYIKGLFNQMFTPER